MRDISLPELYAPSFALQPDVGPAAIDAAYVDYLANDLFELQHPNYKTHHSNSVAFPSHWRDAAVVELASVVTLAPNDLSNDIGSGIDSDSEMRPIKINTF